MDERLLNALRNDPEAKEDAHQAVLNLGYGAWNDPEHPERTREWGFADMVEWTRQNYGDEAAMLIQVGKFNQQVGNGGIHQWLDNGYAAGISSGGRRSRHRTESADFPGVEAMQVAFAASEYAALPHAKDFLGVLQDILYQLEEVDSECYTCKNHRYVTCDTCHGDGKVDCPECFGSGDMEDEETGQMIPCPTCAEHATSSARWMELAPGEVECDECDGEGTMPCSECNEDGQIEEDGEVGIFAMKTDYIDSRYYKFSDAFMSEIDNKLKAELGGAAPAAPAQPQGLLAKAAALRAVEGIEGVLNRILEAFETKNHQDVIDRLVKYAGGSEWTAALACEIYLGEMGIEDLEYEPLERGDHEIIMNALDFLDAGKIPSMVEEKERRQAAGPGQI